MMLMRDRSGRSGRRRGSQKPGTAIGLLDGCRRHRGAAGGGLAGCAAAGANATALSMTASRT